ncbi:type I-C CRISPR-associated endonuclease Cas1c [Piscinibacter sp.]|uniref:type I-C CRISPR-associated endonuclease Cas1c n=1 Tax=Piscinibacter sp. TaxID=1903157 RepID=UPI002BB42270|nr:type I-C CRISPR-associated endonuclease Cas1c [Albitalea sp.]HUG26117.1 type I-C CRISPR-associated endonuclease Cas1c [Albitalea sp.]
MKHHLNTLFVSTQGAYLAKEGQAVVIRVDKEVRLRVPLHTLDGIICFGQISCSPYLLGACADNDVAVTLMTEHGQFLARVTGFSPGNVLLRREQFRRADSVTAAAEIARAVVLSKIANSRTVLLRAARDHPNKTDAVALQQAATHLNRCLSDALRTAEVDTLRGVEGEAARVYFGVFNHLITAQKDDFTFHMRSRRPPLDNINALLSFLYALLAHDARSACESSGLDAAVGFLHADRPGRPGLALDLMEEFRAFLADRLALSLINRRQVHASGFHRSESGGVEMDDATRKAVLVSYQKRKQEEIRQPFLGETITVGLLLHMQARLLARHLRGDLDAYPPFIWK